MSRAMCHEYFIEIHPKLMIQIYLAPNLSVKFCFVLTFMSMYTSISRHEVIVICQIVYRNINSSMYAQQTCCLADMAI